MTRTPVILIGMCFLAFGCSTEPSGNSPPPRLTPEPDDNVTGRFWNDFNSDQYQFKVSFPRKFARTNRPFAGAHAPWPVLQIDDFSSEKDDDEGRFRSFKIVAGTLSSGKNVKEKMNDALNEMVWHGGFVPKKAKPSEPKAVTWGGRPAVETVYVVEDLQQTKGSRTVVRQLAAERFVYVGVIHHSGDITGEEENRFWDSFKIVQPPAGKK